MYQRVGTGKVQSSTETEKIGDCITGGQITDWKAYSVVFVQHERWEVLEGIDWKVVFLEAALEQSNSNIGQVVKNLQRRQQECSKTSSWRSVEYVFFLDIEIQVLEWCAGSWVY